MEKLKKIKNLYLILTIIGNIMLLYASYLTYGKLKITFIYIIFGFIPLCIQTFRYIQRKNRIKIEQS